MAFKAGARARSGAARLYFGRAPQAPNRQKRQKKWRRLAPQLPVVAQQQPLHLRYVWDSNGTHAPKPSCVPRSRSSRSRRRYWRTRSSNNNHHRHSSNNDHRKRAQNHTRAVTRAQRSQQAHPHKRARQLFHGESRGNATSRNSRTSTSAGTENRNTLRKQYVALPRDVHPLEQQHKSAHPSLVSTLRANVQPPPLISFWQWT